MRHAHAWLLAGAVTCQCQGTPVALCAVPCAWGRAGAHIRLYHIRHFASEWSMDRRDSSTALFEFTLNFFVARRKGAVTPISRRSD
eukprot:5531130-Prymnesium_polylepis.2